MLNMYDVAVRKKKRADFIYAVNAHTHTHTLRVNNSLAW